VTVVTDYRLGSIIPIVRELRSNECTDTAVYLYLIVFLQLITAFAVSANASNWERLSKPFNPLLGETYELDRLVALQHVMQESLWQTSALFCYSIKYTVSTKNMPKVL